MPLYEMWERFKDSLRRCPQHRYQDWVQIKLFYKRLNWYIRTIAGPTVGGTLMLKTIEEAHVLLEKMATNSYQVAQWEVKDK